MQKEKYFILEYPILSICYIFIWIAEKWTWLDFEVVRWGIIIKNTNAYMLKMDINKKDSIFEEIILQNTFEITHLFTKRQYQYILQ